MDPEPPQRSLEILAKRDGRELKTIAAFLRDMYELGVDHVTRLERQARWR